MKVPSALAPRLLPAVDGGRSFIPWRTAITIGEATARQGFGFGTNEFRTAPGPN